MEIEQGRVPSGLFPAGPPRPTYREPHPVRLGSVVAAIGAGGAWLVLFTLLGTGLAGRTWWLFVAGLLSWAAALVLARYGDRGVAVGLALITGLGWTVAAGVVTLYWVVTTDWPLW